MEENTVTPPAEDKALINKAMNKLYETAHDLREPMLNTANRIRSFVGHVNDTPHHMRDNEFIHRGYRVGFNTSHSIARSLFMSHNESITYGLI